ncbi:MAG: hypothetical protein ACREON_13610 [Gemmatimonadaceae bacterium]
MKDVAYFLSIHPHGSDPLPASYAALALEGIAGRFAMPETTSDLPLSGPADLLNEPGFRGRFGGHPPTPPALDREIAFVLHRDGSVSDYAVAEVLHATGPLAVHSGSRKRLSRTPACPSPLLVQHQW